MHINIVRPCIVYRLTDTYMLVLHMEAIRTQLKTILNTNIREGD